jgi:hypothetical protein
MLSVRDSMKTDETDFIVKPLDRDTLLAKVANTSFARIST